MDLCDGNESVGMFMMTYMFIITCMFIITSCPHLNCHFLMDKLSLPMPVDYIHIIYIYVSCYISNKPFFNKVISVRSHGDLRSWRHHLELIFQWCFLSVDSLIGNFRNQSLCGYPLVNVYSLLWKMVLSCGFSHSTW